MQHNIRASRAPNEQIAWTCSCDASGTFHAPNWDVETWTAPWMAHLHEDANFTGIGVTWTS